jgi:hypothetical protein
VIWDGQEVGSDGGTWQALQLTRSMEKPFLHIDVSARTLSVTSNNTRGYMRRDIRSMEDIADVLV